MSTRSLGQTESKDGGRGGVGVPAGQVVRSAETSAKRPGSSRTGRDDAFLAPAGKELVAAVALASILHDHLDDLHDPPPALSAMDADLIKLGNKLQDTFANLGQSQRLSPPSPRLTCF